jgi:hypothetical protein
MRTLYRRDDLTAPLPLGQLQTLGLAFETYKLACTPGLITQVYGNRVSDAMLANEGGYVHSEGDSNWWIPSGQHFFSADPQDTPSAELARARAHFFLARRFHDPFGSSFVVDYDGHDLLTTQTLDPLGNTAHAQNDYRSLQPILVTDPNGNRASVSVDALGMVVGTAVMGKVGDDEGDSLENFDPDLTDAVIAAHLQTPFADPHSILQRATTRVVYDLFAYTRTKEQADPQGVVAYALTRETHDSELAPGAQTRVQHNLSYSDGFGREIQQKVQAEPGPLVQGGAEVSPRWVGSGWTIFNNKGKPVRQYEPFFSTTHAFEFAVTVGVSPILHYDPIQRAVAGFHPNHTYTKIVFDVWKQEAWDVNDTVLQADPNDDADVGDFFRRLPDDEYLPTWYAQREGGALGTQEQAAALKTAVHARTPTVTHLDSLGRPMLTVAHNRLNENGTIVEKKFLTRVELDIEGNQREVIDANERIVMRYQYDMLGDRIRQSSMEAGERWMLNDVAGKPIRAWDSRGHAFRSTYDPLQRTIASHLRQGNGPELQIGRIVYGESQPNPEARNLRGKRVQLFDQAGIVTTDEYDFKGNVVHSRRRLAREYKTISDWSVGVALEAETLGDHTQYDALNRPLEIVAPDNSVIRHIYNEANLLERLQVNLHGGATATSFIADVDYNAKGQRTLINYGNGVRTEYQYDPLTFRLNHLETRRREY